MTLDLDVQALAVTCLEEVPELLPVLFLIPPVIVLEIDQGQGWWGRGNVSRGWGYVRLARLDVPVKPAMRRRTRSGDITALLYFMRCCTNMSGCRSLGRNGLDELILTTSSFVGAEY